MKKIILFAVFFVGLCSYAQNQSGYQYIIVPKTFEFLEEEDRYQLNSLTKFLLEKMDFKVLMSDGITVDLNIDRCESLYADVKKEKSFLSTKLTLLIKDCKGLVVASSEGTSKEKEWKKAYQQSLRDAFTKLNIPKLKEEKVATNSNNETADKIIVNEAFENVEAGTLMVQPIVNGYFVIDADYKIILKLQNTSVKDTFLASSKEISNAIVYKVGEQWVLEYYKGDTLLKEPLKIRF